MSNMAESPTFDVQQKTDRLDIVLSSSMDLIDRADSIVKHVMNDHGLGRLGFAVRVVMREGLTNAVRHGHHHDPAKLIHFHLAFGKDRLTMVIADQGDGFDWKTAMARATVENSDGTLRDHGRGFLIMGEYFDTWAYNEKGNVLTLVKHLSS